MTAIEAASGVAAEVWQGLPPEAATAWFSGLTQPWWIAGGWALDLFAGQLTRPHGDLDVGVLRRDASEVLAVLSAWEIFEAKNSLLTRLPPGTQPRAEVNSLWCRLPGARAWSFELMLDEAAADSWAYRRAPEIQRPLAIAIRRTPQGIPFLAPEIQLLYKARNPRPRDQNDFLNVAGALNDDQLHWLRDALDRSERGHPWLSKL